MQSIEERERGQAPGNKEMYAVLVGLGLIVLATATRLIPHVANFTAMGAVAIFAGYLFRNRLVGFAVVLGAMMLSDIFLGFESLLMRFTVYGALMVSVLAGVMVRNRTKSSGIRRLFGVGAGATLGAGLFFFISTNFVVWASGGMYTLSLEGLWQCYVNALPFYRNALVADLSYGIVLFGSYQLALRMMSLNDDLKVNAGS